MCLLKNNYHQAETVVVMVQEKFLVLVQKKFCSNVCGGGIEGWKKLSCLGCDGNNDGGGLGDKLLLLSLLLLFLSSSSSSSSSSFELKKVGFSFNAFNLLCISISIVYGAFLAVNLQHLFYLYGVLVKANQQLHFARQKWKCL